MAIPGSGYDEDTIKCPVISRCRASKCRDIFLRTLCLPSFSHDTVHYEWRGTQCVRSLIELPGVESTQRHLFDPAKSGSRTNFATLSLSLAMNLATAPIGPRVPRSTRQTKLALTSPLSSKCVRYKVQHLFWQITVLPLLRLAPLSSSQKCSKRFLRADSESHTTRESHRKAVK